LAIRQAFFILYYMKDKEYKKEKRKERLKQKALERRADEILKQDEKSQKLKEQGHKIDINKFKKLF
jgi:hypothetical protein